MKYFGLNKKLLYIQIVNIITENEITEITYIAALGDKYIKKMV